MRKADRAESSEQLPLRHDEDHVSPAAAKAAATLATLLSLFFTFWNCVARSQLAEKVRSKSIRLWNSGKRLLERLAQPQTWLSLRRLLYAWDDMSDQEQSLLNTTDVAAVLRQYWAREITQLDFYAAPEYQGAAGRGGVDVVLPGTAVSAAGGFKPLNGNFEDGNNYGTSTGNNYGAGEPDHIIHKLTDLPWRSCLAVDIGGTRTKFKLVDGDATELVPMGSADSAEIWEAKVDPALVLRNYLKDCVGVKQLERVDRIIFSVPGTLDFSHATETDEMTVVKNMPSFSTRFRGFDFKSHFRPFFPAVKVRWVVVVGLVCCYVPV